MTPCSPRCAPGGPRPTRHSRADRAPAEAGTVAARDAYARARSGADDLWSIAALPLVAQPGRPAPLPVEAPPASGVRIDELAGLAGDAAERAWELATGAGDGGLTLDTDHDLARRAARLLGTREFDALARRAGVTPRRLARQAFAWRAGGAEGVDIMSASRSSSWSSSWTPEPEVVDDGVAALRAAGLRPRVAGNRVTAGRVQLRVAPGGRWYRCDKHGNDWELTEAPHPDPSALLEAIAHADD